MPALKPPPASWEDAILSTARLFMNAEVCFYREIEPDEDKRYNPVTGEGDDAGIAVFWRGKARVQHMRAPREFKTDYQAGASHYFRFQLDPAESGNSLPFLPSGVKARVIDGGRDSSLESLVYVTNSAINSSHMAVRTVELKSNMTPIVWQWNPDGPNEGLFPSSGLFPSYTLFPLIGG